MEAVVLASYAHRSDQARSTTAKESHARSTVPAITYLHITQLNTLLDDRIYYRKQSKLTFSMWPSLDLCKARGATTQGESLTVLCTIISISSTVPGFLDTCELFLPPRVPMK